MAGSTNRGRDRDIVAEIESLVQFVGRYRDEVLAALLMVVGVALVVVSRADLVGGAMVAVGVLAWVSDWLAG